MQRRKEEGRALTGPAGELRHINKLRYWPLESVLHDKYLFPKADADGIAAFLAPMLRLHPDKRARAGELAHHVWLEGVRVQGEADVVRRAEAAERGGEEGAGEEAEADAMKPVDELAGGEGTGERPAAGAGAGGVPKLGHPPATQTGAAKENAGQAKARPTSAGRGGKSASAGKSGSAKRASKG